MRVLPELQHVHLVAFLDSNTDKQGKAYRGITVRAPEWVDGNCDVVLCSSFGHELAQMGLLDQMNVKVVPSHISSTVGRL
jgi:hypothetical protein